MPYGQFYIGKGGFKYKKNGGAGVRKNPSYGLITGVPANVNNKYVYGAGVGAQSTAVRRAKLRFATVCNPEQPCGRFLTKLGIHPRDDGQNINFESGLGAGIPHPYPITLNSNQLQTAYNAINNSFRSIIY